MSTMRNLSDHINGDIRHIQYELDECRAFIKDLEERGGNPRDLEAWRSARRLQEDRLARDRCLLDYIDGITA